MYKRNRKLITQDDRFVANLLSTLKIARFLPVLNMSLEIMKSILIG
jgi:hypothetical protein